MDGHPGEAGRPGVADAELLALLDDERLAEAATERRRAYWRGLQAGSAATLAGLLVDLGERRQLTSLDTVAARPVRGVVTVVGADFCGLRGANGELTLVATAAVTAVRPEPGTGRPLGDRDVEEGGDLAGALTELAARRPPVSVHTVAGQAVTGTLSGAGPELVTVTAPTGDPVSIPTPAVAHVILA